MENFSQLDPRWAHLPIGKTKFTLGKLGCAITSLCMLTSKFHPEKFPIPPEAAAKWAFNANAEILWKDSDFEGMRFVRRGYGYKPEIKEWALQEHRGVIVQVNNSHWIAVEGVENDKLVVHDPIDGLCHTGVPPRYTITGYALFEAVYAKIEVSAYAKDAVKKLTDEGVATDWTNPQKIIAGPEAELMLMRSGALKRTTAQGGVTKEDLAVMIVNLKLV